MASERLGRREPDETHPFGYGKERFFWAFMAATFIFIAGASFSVSQGVRVLITGSDDALSNISLSYTILAVAFVAEGTSFVRAYRQASPTSGLQIRRTLRHVRDSENPTLKTVLLEDGAAVTGVGIAALGLLASRITGSSGGRGGVDP